MKLLKIIFIFLFTILILGYLGLHFFNFANHSDLDDLDDKKNGALRIVAANINFENPNRQKTSELLLGLNADILIVLEYTGSNLDLSNFKTNGYQVELSKPINSPHGICAIVKSSIEVEGMLIKIPYKSPCQMPLTTIRFKSGNDFISVWGVHTPPPVPTCKFKTAETIKDLASYVSNGRLITDLGISKEGDFIIMAGDFNMFWFHPALSELRETGLNDVYAEKHYLPSTTWSPFFWFPQFVGLDYIFCSDHFRVLNSSIIQIEGSDHSLVITDINLG